MVLMLFTILRVKVKSNSDGIHLHCWLMITKRIWDHIHDMKTLFPVSTGMLIPRSLTIRGIIWYWILLLLQEQCHDTVLSRGEVEHLCEEIAIEGLL